MSSLVLVTYATRMGSTKEVAHRIADMLSEHGVSVEVLRANQVYSIEPYQAVVLGSALYAGRLHKDARDFLKRYRGALSTLPVSLFVLGPVHNDEKDWAGARQQLDNQLKRFPWFVPATQKIVGGRFDPAKMSFPFNVIPGLRKMPPCDAMDWTAVRAFADEVTAKLRVPAVH